MSKLEDFFNVLKDQFAWIECRSDDTREKALNKIIEIIRIQNEALAYYATAEEVSTESKDGTRKEFGCGCCAGVIKNEEIDYDDSVIGLTAKEAQQKIEALLEGK